MRSMYVSMLALALTVLLCACVSNVPVWETVDDAQVCQGESRLPSTIVFAVPEGAAVQTFSASGAAQSCSAQDGSLIWTPSRTARSARSSSALL